MTQEELDALMNGDLDIDTLNIEDIEDIDDEVIEEPVPEVKEEPDDAYKISAMNSAPPPATDDNKMVHQLDDVTKESEEKATEIFDIIEIISNEMMQSEEHAQSVITIFRSNIELFTALTQKFPDIMKFNEQLEKNQSALADSEAMLDVLQNSGDSIMSVMDIMQYQDIHRQKIERVINVMRALSTYMNALFEGKVDDEKRVGSATHLPGDESTEEIVSSDDIEELLKSFGQK